MGRKLTYMGEQNQSEDKSYDQQSRYEAVKERVILVYYLTNGLLGVLSSKDMESSKEELRKRALDSLFKENKSLLEKMASGGRSQKYLLESQRAYNRRREDETRRFRRDPPIIV